jgi:hypothetical protein
MPNLHPQDKPSTGQAGTDDTERTVAAVIALAARAPGDARPVAALNPEAGDHRVTTDQRELRAALVAGKQTWRRFGYYEQRYGERGRAFTRSDSAWIVTLAEQSRGVVEGQLRWLGALLAARGMPRWLLEVHLENLHAELVAAVPEKRTSYDTLLRMSMMFREERFSHLDETTSAELAETFDRHLGSTSNNDLPEAGALLVAAVADERSGVDRAVDSLMEWLADPVRFPDVWVTAANMTVAAARELAQG